MSVMCESMMLLAVNLLPMNLLHLFSIVAMEGASEFEKGVGNLVSGISAIVGKWAGDIAGSIVGVAVGSIVGRTSGFSR